MRLLLKHNVAQEDAAPVALTNLKVESTLIELERLLGRIKACTASFQDTLLKKIAGYSLQDALKVASDLNLNADRLAAVLADPEVISKNKRFFREFKPYLEEVQKSAAISSEQQRIELISQAVLRNQTFQPSPALKPDNKLLADIDAVYSGYISEKKFRIADPRLTEQACQEIELDNLFEKYIKAFDKHLLTGRWRLTVIQACGGEQFLDRKLSSDQKDALFAQNTISQKMLFEIAKSCGIDMNSALMRMQLSATRYGSSVIVTSEQRRFCIDWLKDKLLTSLRQKGFTDRDLSLEDGRYSIIRRNHFLEEQSETQTEARIIKEIKSSERFLEIEDIQTIAGELCYKAQLENGKWVLINGNDCSAEFDEIYSIKEITGKLCYAAQVENERCIVIHGDNRSPEFSLVLHLQEIGGKLCYVARLENKKWVAIHDNQRSPEFSDIAYFQVIADKLCYSARLGNGNEIVVHGDILPAEFSGIYSLKEVAGHLGYEAKLPNTKSVVIYGNQRSPEFCRIGEIQEISGQLCYGAKLENGNYIVVYGDKRSNEFYDLGDIQAIEGKLSYKAKLENKKWVVISGDNRSEEFSEIKDFKEIAGKPFYVAKLENSNLIAVHGNKISDEFTKISPLRELAGKPLYYAQLKNGNWVVIHGENRSQEFSNIDHFYILANRPCYKAILLTGENVIIYGNETIYNNSDLQIFEIGGGLFLESRRGSEAPRWIQEEQDLSIKLEDFIHYDRTHAFYKKAGDPKLYFYSLYRQEQSFDINSAHIEKINIAANHAIVLLKEGNDNKFVIFDLNSEVKKPDVSKSEFELSEKEQKYLKLINLVVNPDRKEIEAHLEERSKRSALASNAESMITAAQSVVTTLNQLIARLPKEFKDYFAAKATKPLKPIFDLVLQKIAPKALERFNNPKKSLAEVVSGFSFKRIVHSITTRLNSGDPKETSGKTILHSNLTSGFVADSLVATFSKGDWMKFPVKPKSATTAASRMEFKVPVEESFNGRDQVVLPLALNATYAQSEMFAISKDGQRKALKADFGIDGIAYVSPPKGAKEILYSLDFKKRSTEILDLSEDDYQKFIEKHFKEFAVLGTEITPLNSHCKKFLKRIEHLNPLERIKAIKEFISYHGHYDHDNKDMMSEKRDKSPEDILAIMESRALELKMRGKVDSQKEYAGVCSDFAILYAIMLRASGISAGIAIGVNINSDGSAKSSDGHAKVFVPWQDESGFRYLELEATPGASVLVAENGVVVLEANKVGEEISSEKPPVIEYKGFLTPQELSIMVAKDREAVRRIISDLNPESIQKIDHILQYALFSGIAPEHLAASFGFSNQQIQTKSNKEVSSLFDCMEMHLNGIMTYHYKDLTAQEARTLAKAKFSHLIEQVKPLLEPQEFNAALACLLI